MQFLTAFLFLTSVLRPLLNRSHQEVCDTLNSREPLIWQMLSHYWSSPSHSSRALSVDWNPLIFVQGLRCAVFPPVVTGEAFDVLMACSAFTNLIPLLFAPIHFQVSRSVDLLLINLKVMPPAINGNKYGFNMLQISFMILKVKLILGPIFRDRFGIWCSQWCCVLPAILR